MFKKILIPIDGSKEAVQRLVGLCGRSRRNHAVPQRWRCTSRHRFSNPYFEDVSFHRDKQRGNSGSKAIYATPPCGTSIHEQSRTERRDLIFSRVRFCRWSSPTIVAAAKSYGCDLIVMGPRGRVAWQATLLGSVTTRVLGMSNVTTLVHHSPQL